MHKRETAINLIEHYMARYTAGCFCVGDTLEFDKKMFNTPCFKDLQPEIAAKVKDMAEAQMNGDAIIMVANVSLDPLAADSYMPSTITIAYSLGGGRYYDPVTIPGHLLANVKRIETGVNLAPVVPPKMKINYEERFSKKPRPVDLKKLEKEHKQGHVTSTLM